MFYLTEVSMGLLRVLSWNTALSPSMYDRLSRKEHILRRFEKFSKKVDILALQETGSFVVGRLAERIYHHYGNFLRNHPFVTMLFDYLAIIEGLLFRKREVDNVKELVKCARNNGFKYFLLSKKPKRYINSGLMILSKYPLSQGIEVISEGDVIHRPGNLICEISAKGKKVWISNSYFVPSLKWTKISYIICNIINLFAFKKPKKLRREQLKTLHNFSHRGFMISAGDFNINRGDKEYEETKKVLKMFDSEKGRNSTFKNIFIEKQIDYIFYSPKIKLIKFERGEFNSESDHRPIIASFKL